MYGMSYTHERGRYHEVAADNQAVLYRRKTDHTIGVSASKWNIIGNELIEYCNRRQDMQAQIPNGDIVLSYIRLLVQGKVPFEAVTTSRATLSITTMHARPEEGEFHRRKRSVSGWMPLATHCASSFTDRNVKLLSTHGVLRGLIQRAETLDWTIRPLDIRATTEGRRQQDLQRGPDGYTPIVATLVPKALW